MWTESAPAKVNLTLRITGRRPDDGLHELVSLVMFADCRDELSLTVGDGLALSVTGETAEQTGPITRNLVLRAARELRDRVPDLQAGTFRLTKNLPAAAGLGGGSSDAAAALRLLARANGLMMDRRVTAAARATGADVPVCLDPKPRIMRGIGDELSDALPLPPLHAVLVNPRIAVPTAHVFAAYVDNSVMAAAPPPDQLETIAARPLSAHELITLITQSGNDLEAPAIALFPVIADVLSALRSVPDCRLARMSGSGATCFGLFDRATDAERAREQLQRAQPNWWICATRLG